VPITERRPRARRRRTSPRTSRISTCRPSSCSVPPPSCSRRCRAVDIVARTSERFPNRWRRASVVAELADVRVFSTAQTLVRVRRILCGVENHSRNMQGEKWTRPLCSSSSSWCCCSAAADGSTDVECKSHDPAHIAVDGVTPPQLALRNSGGMLVLGTPKVSMGQETR
jgi:hypothetical protein